MRFINGWESKNKQNDKVTVVFRVGILTVIEFKLDLSRQKLRIMLLNLGFEFD